MTNKEIAKTLRSVAAAYTIKNERSFYFQIVAYKNAADAIENFGIPLETLYKEGKLSSVSGVGKTLQGRLEELFKTGKVTYWESALEGIPQATFVLMEVPSFGPKKAYRLATEFGLNNSETALEELSQIAKKGGISGLAGFGEKSERDIIRAIQEFKKGFGKTTRMVLPLAGDLADQMISYLKKNAAVKQAEPLGSLRRRATTVGDVDIAVASDEPEKVIEHFVDYPFKERVIEKGPTTASLLAGGGHQVDLMVQPEAAFGSLLQHFTGSKNHNVALREYALKKGLSLSEKGIKILKTGKMLTFTTEEDFYEALGLDWIPPEIREDSGEIELAIKHKLPKLLEQSDIKGDFHLHSSFPIEPSHDMGRASILEMTQRALELNYNYLGFSEHNPSISKHTAAQIVDLVKQRNDEIDKIQLRYKNIKIFKGMETDILPTGELALPDNALELLDYSIVSVHSVFSMDREKMTKRILKGLSHPKARILAHPTGRLLNSRPGYEIDLDEIIDFCVKNNKAIEINAYPNRLDLTDTLIKHAIQLGASLVIDTDSHALLHMDLMEYGVSIARRGWATKKNILNASKLDEIAKWMDN